MPSERVIETCKSSCQSETMRSSSDDINKSKCARIAEENAKCFACQQEAQKGEYVILYQCGHWVQRVCFHLWKDGGMALKCPHHCSKKLLKLRSYELMSEEVCAHRSRVQTCTDV